MNFTGKTIARNAGALFISQVATWGLTLVLTVVQPRYLGSTAMGKLALATSLWSIGSIVVAFGMDTLLTKEIARNPARASHLLSVSVTLRLLLHALIFGVVIAYLLLVRAPFDTLVISGIVGVSSLFWQLVAAYQSALQGLERMQHMTLGNIAGKLVNTTCCIAILWLGQGVYAVAVVGILAALAALLIQIRSAAHLLTVRLQLDWAISRDILKASLPYLTSGIFLVAYGQMDVLILSWLVNEKTIGWYGAANQLFATLMFIPNVFITAIFPALSRLYTNTPDALPRLMRKSFDWLLLLSVPIGMGLFVVGDGLVVWLFGPDFAQSGPILALMGLVLILTYQNMLLGRFLISTDRQNAWTLIMLLATLLTIVLDVVLVPWCENTFGNGGIGGSLSFIITEAAMVIYGVSRLPTGSLSHANLWMALRTLLAGLVMVGATWWLRSWTIIVPIVVGALVYVGMLLLLRLIPGEDWATLRQALQAVRARFGSRHLRLEQSSQ
jgi:O-antigen/teichoic acid export membrane protein